MKTKHRTAAKHQPPGPLWYCLSIDGAATLCIDQADAPPRRADGGVATQGDRQ